MNVYGIGRLVADPELRYNPSGTAFANITLAWDTGFGENKKPSFVPFVASTKNAENIAKFFTKGSQIFIKNGELQQRSWEDTEGKKQYKTEVFIREWAFCGGKATNAEGQNPNINDEAPDEDTPF